MALRWIKLKTDIFSNDKMLLISEMENGDELQLIWIKLLCLAGRRESSVFVMKNGTPYTERMLSTALGVGETLLCSALDIFEELCMISRSEGFIKILGWSEHQELFPSEPEAESECVAPDSIPHSERERELTRERVRNFRMRKRNGADGSVTPSVTSVTPSVTTVTPSVTPTVTPSVTTVTPSVTEALHSKYLSFENRIDKNRIDENTIDEKEKSVTPVTEGERNGNADKTKDSDAEGDGDSLFLSYDNAENISNNNADNGPPCSDKTDAAGRGLATDGKRNADKDNKNTRRAAYGCFSNVMLDSDEYARFRDMYPDDYGRRIDELSVYLAQTGKVYKNHLATLISFARQRYEKGPPTDKRATHPPQAVPLPSQGKALKYGDFDPEQVFRNAIRNSPFSLPDTPL